MFGLGGTEMFILLILGVLLFGKKLPEVGRSLGKGLVEFKKGLSGIEDEVTGSLRSGSPPPPRSSKNRPTPSPVCERPHGQLCPWGVRRGGTARQESP
jgi:sec-independent protein translocase protein TatA